SSLQHWSPVTVKSSPPTSEQWRSFKPTASATSCSSHARSPTLPTLPDFGHGTRLAASLNGEKKGFSFSPRWSEDEARRIQQPTNRVMTQQPKVTGRCTDSGPSIFSKDYLVICGRPFAHSMESACRCTSRYPSGVSSHNPSALHNAASGGSYGIVCPQMRGSESNGLI